LNLRNIAVFIDFENFGTQEVFNAKILVEKLKEKGRLIVKKAYADWGRYAGYKRQMLESSIELTELPSHGKRGKNSADIKLVVDALETAITRQYIDTIVVVSGDSDYTPLISKLREYNKYVIVIGNRQNVSELLKGYCDELIYYSTLIGQQECDKIDISNSYQLLKRTIILLEREGIESRGSQIKSKMKQLDSSFDESNYGFSQFKKYLKAAEDNKIISLKPYESGGDVIAELINEEKNDNIISDTSYQYKVNSILAKIRKRGMQFLGYELQQIVILELFNILHNSKANPMTRSDILNQLIENQLKEKVSTEGLSKNKISSVLNIFIRGGVIDMVKKADEASPYINFKSDLTTFEIFRKIHDSVFFVIGENDNFSKKDWGILLYGDSKAIDNFDTFPIEKVRKFLNE